MNILLAHLELSSRSAYAIAFGLLYVRPSVCLSSKSVFSKIMDSSMYFNEIYSVDTQIN